MTPLDVVRPVTAPSRTLRDRFPSSPFIWWAMGLALTAGLRPGHGPLPAPGSRSIHGPVVGRGRASARAHPTVRLGRDVRPRCRPVLLTASARLSVPGSGGRPRCRLADRRRAGDAGALPAGRCRAGPRLASRNRQRLAHPVRPAGVGRRRAGRRGIDPRGATRSAARKPGRACGGDPVRADVLPLADPGAHHQRGGPGDGCPEYRTGARSGRLDDGPSGTGRDARADLGGGLGAHLPALLAAARSGAARVARGLRRVPDRPAAPFDFPIRSAPDAPVLAVPRRGHPRTGVSRARGRAGCPVPGDPDGPGDRRPAGTGRGCPSIARPSG